MRLRARREQDDRLDWRDPDMPVIGKSGKHIDHELMVMKARGAMLGAHEPNWQDDPTYNLRKK